MSASDNEYPFVSRVAIDDEIAVEGVEHIAVDLTQECANYLDRLRAGEEPVGGIDRLGVQYPLPFRDGIRLCAQTRTAIRSFRLCWGQLNHIERTAKMAKLGPHLQAISIVARLVIDNMGGTLEATANCNQCSEVLTINLLEGIADVHQEKRVGSVRPDLVLIDGNGEPVRFIEVVDSHAPERNVHEYALSHGIEIFELHLRAEREFNGRRRNKALDASLTIKARLRELADGRVQVDAHNLLCRKPPCQQCGVPLPLRTVVVSTTDCWNCGQNMNVAIGYKDGKHLQQDYFTTEEIEFAKENGVTLKRRFSATAMGKYLANVCTICDRIQGNWFLYMDPFHDRFNLFRTKRQEYGPCDKCATRFCMTHGEYRDYQKTQQCPACLEEVERVMCPNNPERECFYPDRCQQNGCYFVNRYQGGFR